MNIIKNIRQSNYFWLFEWLRALFVLMETVLFRTKPTKLQLQVDLQDKDSYESWPGPSLHLL